MQEKLRSRTIGIMTHFGHRDDSICPGGTHSTGQQTLKGGCSVVCTAADAEQRDKTNSVPLLDVDDKLESTGGVEPEGTKKER